EPEPRGVPLHRSVPPWRRSGARPWPRRTGPAAPPQVSVELDRSGAPAPEAARPCGAVTLRGCLAAGGGVSRLWNNTRERPVIQTPSCGRPGSGLLIQTYEEGRRTTGLQA